ncbi:pectin methylesterase 31 [Wolffia australiana]
MASRRVLTVAPPCSGGGRVEIPIGEEVYKTVQEAIDAVPLGNKVRIVILIPPGVYRQPVYIPKTKNFITLAGSQPETTVLTWHNTASRIEHHMPSQVIGTGTFGCGSTIIEGEDFIAENITFENSAPQGSGQAVAVRVTADRCAFYNCRFLGGQDTLYLHYGKQYLKDCYIEGSVDFIFGNSTALLEHCHVHCKSQGFITAQSRKSAEESTGYIFLRCVITGNGSSAYSYLGRPWGSFARVLYAYTWMDSCIKPMGWHNWDKPANEKSACFFQFRCSGPGSDHGGRVPWCRELEEQEAKQLLLHSFIDPDPAKPWLVQRMSTRIPLSV